MNRLLKMLQILLIAFIGVLENVEDIHIDHHEHYGRYESGHIHASNSAESKAADQEKSQICIKHCANCFNFNVIENISLNKFVIKELNENNWKTIELAASDYHTELIKPPQFHS